MSRFRGHKFFMVDSVGEHRGMHYYNFPLVAAMKQAGAEVELISTAETAVHSLRPADIAIRAGFQGIYGSHSKLLRGLQYARSLVRIGRWIWRDRPQLVHFHFFQIPILDYLLLRWLRIAGVRTVITVHDVLPFGLGQQITDFRGRLFVQLYRSADGLIAHSAFVRDLLQELDTSLNDKVSVIRHHNFTAVARRCHIAQDEARERLQLPTRQPLILVFGTIKPNKRLDLVIEAMVDVCRIYPDARLVVAGKPREHAPDPYLQMAAALGIEHNVVWRLDYVSDQEMNLYFAAADVVVFPYQWIYQSGVLIMAMNFGKPVVATAVGSNSETISDGETGMLVPLDDPAAMARAITTILSDAQLAAAMGAAAYAYVTDELSVSGMAAATLDFYQQVLSENGNGSSD